MTRAAAAVLVLLAVLAVPAARATTQPGTVYVSKLVIDDHAIRVHVRRNTWASSVRYVRGAEVRFVVSNRGTRPVNLNILGSVTGVLRPGHTGTMLVSWTHRGRYVFRVRKNGPALRVAVS
jgi:hypothetical protein